MRSLNGSAARAVEPVNHPQPARCFTGTYARSRTCRPTPSVVLDMGRLESVQVPPLRAGTAN
jgi:hypothetical protein